MKVLQTISGRFLGGGQIVALDFKKLLPTAGLSVEMCSLGTGAPLVVAASEYVLADYDGRYNRPDVLARATGELRRVLRASAPDIVHSHGWDASIIAALALGRFPRTVHLVHWHTTDAWLTSSSLKKRVRRLCTRALLFSGRTTLVAVAEAVENHLQHHLKSGPIRILYNGVDTQRFTPRESRPTTDRLILGCAARLNPTKGIDDLISALIEPMNAQSGLEASIAGEGAEMSSLAARLRTTGLGSRVVLRGLVSDMPRYYRELDLFVLPSRSDEGLPLVLLEAMAAGVPVIATTVGGTPEVVRDGIDGFLVPPGDPPRLAAAITRALSDPERLRQMGQNARERVVSTFSMERWLDQLRALYADLLQGRTSTPA